MNISYTPLFIAITSTFIAISVLRPFAISINLTDSPNIRKKHKGIVPLIGGLGMFFGFLISVLTTSNDLNQIKLLINQKIPNEVYDSRVYLRNLMS